MNILFYDVETAPSLAYVWKIWKENIGTNQLLDSGRVISWAARYLGDPEDQYLFMSEHTHSHAEMIEGLHETLEEADVICAYNGDNFDRPVVNAEFLRAKLSPPAPSKQIDLYRVVKKNFRFISNRLEYVARHLGLEGKLDTGGFSLWARCLEGDPEAWETMEEYNAQDVFVLEELYHRLLPWIKDHPNHGIGKEGLVCPNCGGTHVQRRGTTTSVSYTYQRFQCQDCGTWSRQRLSEKATAKPTLTQDKTR